MSTPPTILRGTHGVDPDDKRTHIEARHVVPEEPPQPEPTEPIAEDDTRDDEASDLDDEEAAASD